LAPTHAPHSTTPHNTSQHLTTPHNTSHHPRKKPFHTFGARSTNIGDLWTTHSCPPPPRAPATRTPSRTGGQSPKPKGARTLPQREAGHLRGEGGCARVHNQLHHDGVRGEGGRHRAREAGDESCGLGDGHHGCRTTTTSDKGHRGVGEGGVAFKDGRASNGGRVRLSDQHTSRRGGP
jgi:hypothetical protein